MRWQQHNIAHARAHDMGLKCSLIRCDPWSSTVDLEEGGATREPVSGLTALDGDGCC